MQYRRVLLVSLLTSLLLVGAVVRSQEPQPEYRLTVRAERESAVYAKSEKIVFRVQLLEKDKPLAGQKIQYTIIGDGRYEKKGTVDSTDSFALIEASLDRPGFLRCNVDWSDGTNKASALAGAGVAPLEIKSARPEPADFDEFWNKKKAEMLQLPLEVKMEKVDPGDKAKPGIEVFDVKVNCPGGAPVSGYLAKPVDAKPKSLPIYVVFHGAGVESSIMGYAMAHADGALAIDVNAHGLDNGQPKAYYDELSQGRLKNYYHETDGIPNRQLFIGMYQRIFRSLQFMKSQPEWDGKTLIAFGGSQGGAQAIVASGLDPDVTFVRAYVPALCYLTGRLDGDFDGWPGFMGGRMHRHQGYGHLSPETIAKVAPEIIATMPYIDVALHAKRAKAECALTVGFIDELCSPTSIYVAFNNITAPKHIFDMPETGHTTSPAAGGAVYKLLQEHIKKQR